MNTETHHAHLNLPIWRKYLFSTDHKVIGIQYALTAMSFLLIGFGLMLLMRWQLARPGEPIPLIGGWFGEESFAFPDGIMTPEFYNALGAMHGTIMVFLGVVPLAVAAAGLALSQIPFLLNFALSIVAGKKVGPNPWNATTLEWAAPSPPLAHGNFETDIKVYRGPYEYSVPGAEADYTPQGSSEEN